MRIPFLKLYGYAHVNIGRKGILAEATMKKWRFGPLLITGKGLDKIYGTEDDGPIVRLEISNKKQEFYMSGLVDLFGNTGSEIYLVIGNKEIEFLSHMRLLGAFETKIHGKTLPQFKGFDLDGFIRIGKQKASIKGHLGDDSKKTVFLFHLNKFTMEECVEAVNDVIYGAIKIRPLPAKVIGFFNPDVEYKDVNFGLAMSKTIFEGHEFPEGLSFDAKIILPFVKVPIRLRALIDKTGLYATGSAKKIKIGPLKVSGTGLDKKMGTADDGPVVHLALSKNPEFYLDGIVDLFGIKSSTRIKISKGDFSFETKGKIGKLFETKLYARSVGTTPKDFDFIVDGEFQSDFYKVIKTQMRKDITKIQDGARKGITKAQHEVDKINKAVKRIDQKIAWRSKRIKELDRKIKRRIAANIQKINRAQNKVRGERKKVARAKAKIAGARRKVIRTRKRCKRLSGFWRTVPRLACYAALGIAEAFLYGLEKGIGITAEIGLRTALTALQIAKATAVLDPKNLPEQAKVVKLVADLALLGPARLTLTASRDVAKGILEVAKQTVIGFGHAVRAVSEGVLSFEKVFDIKRASFRSSLREFFEKGKAPLVELTVTTLGTTKTVKLQFDFRHPFKSVGLITAGLFRLAFVK
jgi:hypothetical protein